MTVLRDCGRVCGHDGQCTCACPCLPAQRKAPPVCPESTAHQILLCRGKAVGDRGKPLRAPTNHRPHRPFLSPHQAHGEFSGGSGYVGGSKETDLFRPGTAPTHGCGQVTRTSTEPTNPWIDNGPDYSSVRSLRTCNQGDTHASLTISFPFAPYKSKTASSLEVSVLSSELCAGCVPGSRMSHRLHD